MDADLRIRRLAEARKGYVTSDELRAAGLSPKQIHSRKKRGDLISVLPRVWRVAGVPETFDGMIVAVSLWLNRDGFFNGPTAAFRYGLEGIEAPKVITVSRYTGGSVAPWIRINRLKPDDCPPTRWVRGVQVSSVERAVAECCGVLPARRVGQAMDDALRKRLTTLERLQRMAAEWDGRRGARVLRDLVAARDPDDERIRSLMEKRMLAITRRVREHPFVPNFEVIAGGARYFIDFYVTLARLGIECHSRRWHLGRHAEDARRDRAIRSLGIELLYFTWEDVRYHAEDVEREIRDAIARRLPEARSFL